MKNFFVLLVVVFPFLIHAQEEKEQFDGHHWEAPYHLSIPKGWTIERFLIPIAFAPSIHLKGVEDIRFTPGWGKKDDPEYWSYAFLWYLVGKQDMSIAQVEKNLQAYYSGLLRVNTDSAGLEKMDASLRIVKTQFIELPALSGDVKTFSGTVEMLDYMQFNRISLQVKVHLKYCGEQKTIVFYQLSPQKFDSPVWQGLNELWSEFKCQK